MRFDLLATTPVYNHPLFKAVLVLHVLAAVVWVGGGFAIGVLGLVDRSNGDLENASRDLVRAGRVRTWCFMPASLVLLVCGFGLVALGHLSLAELWLDLALGGWFVALGIGTGYLVPASEELAHHTAREIPEADLRSLIARLRVAGAIESFILVLVVVDMVIRP